MFLKNNYTNVLLRSVATQSHNTSTNQRVKAVKKYLRIFVTSKSWICREVFVFWNFNSSCMPFYILSIHRIDAVFWWTYTIWIKIDQIPQLFIRLPPLILFAKFSTPTLPYWDPLSYSRPKSRSLQLVLKYITSISHRGYSERTLSNMSFF